MSLAHLCHIIGDLADALPEDDAKKLIDALTEAASQLASLPVDAIVALDQDLVECDTYDSMDFTEVPPIPESGIGVCTDKAYTYIIGDDGEMSFYWKFEK